MMAYKAITSLVVVILIGCAISRDINSLKACKKCYKKVILKSKASCLGDPTLPENECNKEISKCLKKYYQCAAKFCPSLEPTTEASTTVATTDPCRIIDKPECSAKQYTECECTECSQDDECNKCKCKNCFASSSRDIESLKACKKCYKKIKLKPKASCLEDPECLKKYDQCAAKFCPSLEPTTEASTTVATIDPCRHLIDNPVKSAKQCAECECIECSKDYECNNCKCKNCFAKYKCSSTNYPSSNLDLRTRIALRGQCFDEYEDCKKQAEEDGGP